MSVHLLNRMLTWVSAHLPSRLSSILHSSPFLRHVLTLVTGTAAAQGIAFLMTMVLARVYTPKDMGMLATYTSIVGVIVAVAALRYDMAIMLPRKDSEALSVARVGIVCMIVVCLVACVMAFPLRQAAAARWGSEVAAWLPLVGVTSALMASIELFKYWLNRHSRYRAIAVNQAEQQIGLTGGQLVLGVAGLGGLPGLILGHTFGQLFAFVNLGRQVPELRHALPADAPSAREVIVRYRRMPLLNAPNALVDAVRLSGIQLLIAGYSVAELGQFQMAWRVLDAPLILINGAVSRVFFQKLALVTPGHMSPLVRALIRRALVVGIIPFGVIYILSPWIFPLFFGVQWDSAGGFARALTPWLFMLLITSPISNLFVVTGHQDWMLGFSLIYAAVPLAWLAFSPFSLLVTAYVLGVLMAVLLVGMTFMADLAAKRFDRCLK